MRKVVPAIRGSAGDVVVGDCSDHHHALTSVIQRGRVPDEEGMAAVRTVET